MKKKVKLIYDKLSLLFFFRYYKCFNNVVTDKLVSGYYSRQKLSGLN